MEGARAPVRGILAAPPDEVHGGCGRHVSQVRQRLPGLPRQVLQGAHPPLPAPQPPQLARPAAIHGERNCPWPRQSGDWPVSDAFALDSFGSLRLRQSESVARVCRPDVHTAARRPCRLPRHMGSRVDLEMLHQSVDRPAPLAAMDLERLQQSVDRPYTLAAMTLAAAAAGPERTSRLQ